MAQTWSDLASDARKAASRLAGEHYRSCLNRAYYAAYSKVTADLSALGAVEFSGAMKDRSIPAEPGPAEFAG